MGLENSQAQFDKWNGIAPDGDDLWLRSSHIEKLLEKMRTEQQRLEKEQPRHGQKALGRGSGHEVDLRRHRHGVGDQPIA